MKKIKSGSSLPLYCCLLLTQVDKHQCPTAIKYFLFAVINYWRHTHLRREENNAYNTHCFLPGQVYYCKELCGPLVSKERLHFQIQSYTTVWLQDMHNNTSSQLLFAPTMTAKSWLQIGASLHLPIFSLPKISTDISNCFTLSSARLCWLLES